MGIVLILLLVAAFYFFFVQNNPNWTFGRPRSSGDSALEVLERRYAAGDITTEEYEERRACLAQDQR